MHPSFVRCAGRTRRGRSQRALNTYGRNASATIRALNRALQWDLPTDGPKTVNGLLVERLESIPEPGTMLKVDGYAFEVLQTGDNTIKTVRVQAVGSNGAAA